MENIKTNFERIMDHFDDSLTHSAPKKLNFDFLNRSLNDDSLNSSKKRRISFEHNDADATASNLDSKISFKTEKSLLNSSATANVPTNSPWEKRRLQADLLDYKTQIVQLTKEIERQHVMRKEIEVLYEAKVSELKRQCEFSSNKVQDVERHMKDLRKRDRDMKEQLNKSKQLLSEQQSVYEKRIKELWQEQEQLRSELYELHQVKTDLSACQEHVKKVESRLEILNDELTCAHTTIEQQKARLVQSTELQCKFALMQQELHDAKSKILNLQSEIDSYKDYKDTVNNAQQRLLRFPQLERDVAELTEKNRRLHDLLANKLLLEEQLYQAQTQLKLSEGAKEELIKLQVEFKHVDQELKQWIQVAQDHCPPNTLVSPAALRHRIENILQRDLEITDEQHTKLAGVKKLEHQLRDCEDQRAALEKKLEQYEILLQRHKQFKDRAQRKLFLVSKERDCYKNLVENFDKDLTVSTATTAVPENNNETQLRMRIDILERTVNSYKEMNEQLEKQIGADKQFSTSGDKPADVGLNSEVYEHLKKEIDDLRKDNERIRRRKEELENEMEHRFMKGDFNAAKYKVVHFKNNPTEQAYENSRKIVEKLQAEIERLKRRCQKYAENEEITQNKFNDTGLTTNIQEVNTLRAELESMQNKMKKMKDVFKIASNEFRDVVYMLLGWRIDRSSSEPPIYSLSCQFAESPDDYLSFRMGETDALELLSTPYSDTIGNFIENHLLRHKSLPAFLSALTLDLFQRSTVTVS